MLKSRWKHWWPHRRGDVFALASIVFFFVAFFPQVLFGDRFIITGDAYFHSHPLRTVAWNMIRSGELPQWTPYVLAGYPLLSMSQVAIGYPFTWGYLFLPGLWAEQVYVLAPYLLSPIFTYAYVREIGRSRLAALLAGLAFGFGGMMCGFISNSGILTNSLLWTPLVLLFIDRVQRRSIAHCLPRATLAYALAVLAGHPQSYVYAGVLIAAYGFYLSICPATRLNEDAMLSWRRWRPLIVALASMVLAAGIAAFQLFESLRVAHRSIRSEITYQRFSEGSFSFKEALLSIGAPLYHYVDTSTFLAPIALLFAVACLVLYSRRDRSDSRSLFWIITALVSFVLLLGSNTPLSRVAYLIPVLKQFRVPSRHTFEWTLAVSILAAYGWDRTRSLVRGSKKLQTRNILAAVALAVLAIGIGFFWWRLASAPAQPHPTIFTNLHEGAYWLWKLGFTIVIVFLVVWCFIKLPSSRAQSALLGTAILIACFVEPAVSIWCWWGGRLSLHSARLQMVSPTTRLLQQFPAVQNRVYTRTELFAEEFGAQPRLESPNLHALHGLHNIAGMEPLILERFSRALGNIGPDSVTPLPGFPDNDDIFSARSHVLDLLNTTHVVSFVNLRPFLDQLIYRDRVGISSKDLGVVVGPGQSVKLTGSGHAVNGLAIVSSLANSVGIAQGTPVARVYVTMNDSKVEQYSLRAGIDTAEWAHDRPDVKTVIQHQNAAVYESRPGDEANSFAANRYYTRVALADQQSIAQVEIENISQGASLALWHLTLYDSTAGYSCPIIKFNRSEFWQTIYSQESVEVLQNTRAQPRAWLVA
ncbi:MAG: hypothetical protein C5B55_12070, partial [Blastocatellia bacterium]